MAGIFVETLYILTSRFETLKHINKETFILL